MYMRRWIICVVLLALVLPVYGVNPYPQLEVKAERAFGYGEWASAAAIFDLMLEQKPDVPGTYGRAIVANGMRDATSEQMRLLSQALDNHVPFDSVFANVEKWSSYLGRPRVYEKFLVDTRSEYPWMRRAINATLLKYYTFRENGPEMVEYSRAMLEGAPDNTAFLESLARGYMLTDRIPEGLATYKRILTVEPDNYNVLLTVGNWYAMHPDGVEDGRIYLERAYALHPTPYVAKLLGKNPAAR